MTQPYQFLRIDKDVLIKVPRRTAGNLAGDIYLYFGEVEDQEETPLILGGEIAGGLREWISGSRTFQVTPHGVLDLYSALVQNHEAERALEGNEAIKFPLVNVGSMVETTKDRPLYIKEPPQPQPQNMHAEPPSAVPKINIDAITEGIRKRGKL